MKTLDVSRLIKDGKKSGMKFTTLMCWCIGKAASQIEEFYTLPENGKLFQYILGGATDCEMTIEVEG